MTPDQFLLFADPLPEPTLLLADDGLIFAGNRAVEQRLGIPVSRLEGKRLAEIVDESPDKVSHYLRLCCRSRNLVLGAMRLRVEGVEGSEGVEGVVCRMEGGVLCPKKEGAAAVLQLRMVPRETATGQFLALNRRIKELGREVQRRKRAEVEARQQEEWLQVTLHSIGDGVICTDAHGRVTMMNPVAEFLTGWTQAASQGQPLEDVFSIFNEQSRKPVANPVDKVLRDGVIVGLANHTILVARDGVERPIADSAAPIRDESGKIHGVVLIFRDVTQQRQAELELRSSEARKGAILDTALDCIITMDLEGNVVDFNPAAEKTFGWPSEQVIGRQLADFIIPPSLRERHRKGLAHYLATGEGPILGKRVELPAVRADGTEFPVEMSINRIPANGPPLFTAYLRDISERKRVERYRNARLAVTHELSVAVGPDDGTSGILQAVCENLGWDIGFFWTVNPGQTTLTCATGWHRHDLAMTEFEAASFIRTFEKGSGFPGHVWSTGEPRWLLDVVRDADFPRAASAARYDLHSAFGCPVVVGDRTLGVIEFFSKQIREPDADLLEMMGTVAGIFGQFLERHESEEELRQSEEKLRLLADTIPQLAWMAAPDGNVFWYNRRWYEYTGTTPEQMQGWGWQLVHDPDMLPSVLEHWKSSIDSGEPFEMEFPLKSADGRFRTFLTRVNPLKDGDGQVVYWFGTNTDIAELREARDALFTSEERLRLALDAGQMGVWDWNVRTGELQWSESLEPLHGLDPGTFGGTFDHFQQLIHREDREAVNTAIRQALEISGEFYVEFRNLRKNAGIHWIAGSGKVYPGDDGKPLRMIGIGLDVTQRKRAEQTARFLADASAALAVLVDFDSTLQKVSSLAVPSFADWSTVDLAEADGSVRRVSVSHVDPAKVQLAHEIHRRFPPDPAAPQGVWNILRTGKSEIISEITDELLVRSSKDDEMLGIIRELGLRSYIGVPLTVRGKTLGVITFINAESDHRYDLTDLAVAEDLASRAAIAIENSQLYQELREADQRKDEFLATLAHELRNPLAPIRNGLQVMRLAGDVGEMVEEARSMMDRQVTQMVRLVDDLLDVSRITRNKLDLKKKRVTLETIIQSAVETSRPLIDEAGHTLTIHLPPTPIYLDADLTRLAQVFSNLLNNSAKYTEPGGRIVLTGELSGDEVAVRIRDNGLGIPAEALPQLFKLFSQVDCNMERAQGGLGIGLTLVQRLTQMHGGAVDARSDGPGQGSEFTVRLPVLELTQSVATPPEQTSVLKKAQRRILVVDDNRDSAMSLGMMLKLMGNVIHTVHDGLAAVEAAEQFRPDMILLDIGLPKLNGYDACRRIREQPWSAGMEIVALTGWGQDEDRRRSKAAGFDHHMVKPIELATLEKLLIAPAARSSPSETVKPIQASLRVLVVDDLRGATHMLGTLLRAAGHEVWTASDGPGGLAAALQYRPDVVLLDIGLPGMSGLEVAKRIRKQPALQGVVLVAMTGYGEESDRQRSLEAGFDHHLVKPADINTVHEVLATVSGNTN